MKSLTSRKLLWILIKMLLFRMPQFLVQMMHPFPPLPIVHLGIERLKDDSKWCCKVEDYMEKYNMKWLLTTHSKKMHSLALEKGKLGCPSTHIKGLR